MDVSAPAGWKAPVMALPMSRLRGANGTITYQQVRLDSTPPKQVCWGLWPALTVLCVLLHPDATFQMAEIQLEMQKRPAWVSTEAAEQELPCSAVQLYPESLLSCFW